jgi:outer membrane protein TolC
MTQHIKALFLFTFLCLFQVGFSQQALSLEEALKIALQNNYNIIIAKNELFIDQANNTTGNAGMLPELNLNFGRNSNINNTKQEFFSGDVREGSGVKTNNLNANLLMNWTLFDGFQMFVNRDRLREIESIGKLNIQIQMENTISDVMMNYYNINQLQKRIETIEKAIQFSKERLDLVKLRNNVGTGSGLEILQAEVDINSDSTLLIRQKQVLRNSKTNLNEVLSRSPELDFYTTADQVEIKDFNYDNLINNATQRSLALNLAEKNIRLSALNIKQFESNQYPTIDLNVGYNYTRFDAEIGILKFNQNRGLSYGLTGRWNIFNGYNNKRQIQIAKLGMETNKLIKEQSVLNISSSIFTAYTDYKTSVQLISLEEGNIKIAKQNLDVSSEKMRLGSLTAIELRQAQLNLVDAEFRKISAGFEAKLAEINIMRLTGDLVK